MKNGQLRVLICKMATGQVLNTDFKTLFSANTPTSDRPYLYFNSLDEVKAYAEAKGQQLKALYLAVYEDDVFITNINGPMR